MDVPEREPSACDRNTGLLWRIDSRRGGQWADHPFREGRRMRKVPTRQAALTLVEEGHSYEEAGLRLGVPPGLAYLTATGVPADSSDGLSAGDLGRPGLLPAAQGLVNPRTEQPDRSAHVRAFLSARAGADPQMQAAAKVRRPG
jgi:hypothetical protein